ncbi:MAG TPA: GNAT family N-acetyltransferase [Candidatus Limnocylindria bacterium]|nr:GNAT family N-acetyltransferase [Candidatus Limnocylindria bacterium]
MTDLEPGITLRPAAEADAPAVKRLVDDAYGHYQARIGRRPMPMLMDQAAAIRDREVWVLADDGRVVGVIDLQPDLDHVLIVNVAVDPQHQGRGLGSRLLVHAEQRARELNLPEVRLYTNERFVENLALYGRRGYRETHRVPAGTTAVVHMRKRLDGG